tara:strand:+ start:218 stop:385 length:168 start_codon:yes stop_codon:yes gene_type:complete
MRNPNTFDHFPGFFIYSGISVNPYVAKRFSKFEKKINEKIKLQNLAKRYRKAESS